MVLTPILIAFFNQPLFLALLAVLALELVSGIYKAWVLKAIQSSKLGNVLTRAFSYTVVFILLQIIVGVAPSFLIVMQLAMLAICLKEGISILENLKTVNLAQGEDNDIINKLVEILGLDMNKLLDEAKTKVEEKN